MRTTIDHVLIHYNSAQHTLTLPYTHTHAYTQGAQQYALHYIINWNKRCNKLTLFSYFLVCAPSLSLFLRCSLPFLPFTLKSKEINK